MQILPNKLYLAMNAAMFIAYNGNEDTPVSGSAIVDYCNLNKRALEPVLQRLSSEGLIVSVKGAKGGYYMPNPETITLREIVEAFVSRVVPDKHEFAGYDTILNEKLENCYDGWLDSLSDVSFKRLCRKARTAGNLDPINAPVLNFAI
tara:strand:- start:9174 stop:9617 length:444 start_codon:yes stop_codon:yes gene_type:complete